MQRALSDKNSLLIGIGPSISYSDLFENYFQE